MRITLSKITLLLALLFSCAAQSQTIVFQDSDHVIYHQLIGDSVIITVEDLKDFTLDLTDDLDPAKFDWIMFMFDIDQTGLIDAGTGTDVYYTNDVDAANTLCKGDILTSNSAGMCGGLITSATLSIGLETTTTSNTPHMVYEISIPKSELYTGSQVCTRMSVKIGNVSGVSTVIRTFPSSTDLYFVNVFFPISLFESVDLGEEIQYCTGDSVMATTPYPSYLWSDNSVGEFFSPKDSGLVHLTVKDNTCSLSDTVNLIIQDENYCTNINLRFPNIVTPNSDGLNDSFEPLASSVQRTMNYTGVELRIYNRWGVKVGGEKGQAPFWDCYLDWGKKAPPGTYYYVFNPGSTGSEAVTGFFTVLYTEK